MTLGSCKGTKDFPVNQEGVEKQESNKPHYVHERTTLLNCWWSGLGRQSSKILGEEGKAKNVGACLCFLLLTSRSFPFSCFFAQWYELIPQSFQNNNSQEIGKNLTAVSSAA